MADALGAAPEQILGLEPPPLRALELLRRRDFRRVYSAVAVSKLGDAFQYIALMWIALGAGGALGVLAVRLADSIPALVFGLHGGLVADRLDRKRTLVAMDLVRAALLVPLAVAGLADHLPLWALIVAAFAMTTATSYFEPAYGALLPSLVERRNVQAANGLVQSTNATLSVVGWSLAAALLAFLPMSVFFALNAVSFVVSAALIATLRVHGGRHGGTTPPQLREGFELLRARPALLAAIAAIAVAVTISSGTWIVGVPTLVETTLGRGAAAFSLIAAAYAIGSTAAGLVLTRRRVRRKALASTLAWTIYLPGYLLFALAHSLPAALVAGAVAGVGQSSAIVLANAAAQEDVPDGALGRVMGLISLTHRGAHATGLLLVAPLFAFLAPTAVFAAAAFVLGLVGLIAASMAATPRGSRRSA